MQENILEELVYLGIITPNQMDRVKKMLAGDESELWNLLTTTPMIAQDELNHIYQVLGVPGDGEDQSAAREILQMQVSYGIPFVNLEYVAFEPVVTRLIPEEMARKLSAIPLARISDSLTVAMADPLNQDTLEQLKFSTGYEIETVYSPKFQIDKMIDKIYKEVYQEELFENITPEIDSLIGEEKEYKRQIESIMEDNHHVVKYVNAILTEMLRNKFEEAQLRPYEKQYMVEFMKGGTGHKTVILPDLLYRFIINRMKLMAGVSYWLQPPQEGQIHAKFNNRNILFNLNVKELDQGELLKLKIGTENQEQSK